MEGGEEAVEVCDHPCGQKREHRDDRDARRLSHAAERTAPHADGHVRAGGYGHERDDDEPDARARHDAVHVVEVRQGVRGQRVLLGRGGQLVGAASA